MKGTFGRHRRQQTFTYIRGVKRLAGVIKRLQQKCRAYCKG